MTKLFAIVLGILISTQASGEDSERKARQRFGVHVAHQTSVGLTQRDASATESVTDLWVETTSKTLVSIESLHGSVHSRVVETSEMPQIKRTQRQQTVTINAGWLLMSVDTAQTEMVVITIVPK